MTKKNKVNDKYIEVNEKIIFNEDVECEQNLNIIDSVGINSGLYVGEDLNTRNINSFGLILSYGNIFSSGNIFISDNNNPNYIYLENTGSITCNNIKMVNNVLIGNSQNLSSKSNNIISIGNNAYSCNQNNNSISIGSNSGSQYQNENSIIINASNNNINAYNSGLYIKPVRENYSTIIIF